MQNFGFLKRRLIHPCYRDVLVRSVHHWRFTLSLSLLTDRMKINMVSDQVRHKPVCTVEEAGQKQEILDLRSEGFYCLWSENKDADQLCTAQLISAFVFAYAIIGFLMRRLNFDFRYSLVNGENKSMVINRHERRM